MKTAAASERRREAIIDAVASAMRSGLDQGGHAHIDAILTQFGRATGSHRVYVGRLSATSQGRQTIDVTHEWCAPGYAGRRGNTRYVEKSIDDLGLARWVSVLAHDEPILGPFDLLPATEHRWFTGLPTRAVAIAPLRVNDALWGLLGFDDVDRDQAWSLADIGSLRAMANLLAGIVTHHQLGLALNDSEHRLANLLAFCDEPLMILDEEFHFTDVNPPTCELLRRTRSEILQLQPPDLHPVDRLTRLMPLFERLTADGEARFELPTLRGDGTGFTAEVRVRWLPGTPRRVLASMHDASQRNLAERYIIEATEAEQRRIGQDLHDGLCQHLKSLEVRLAVVEGEFERQGLPRVEEISRIGNEINAAVKAAYAISRGLLPTGVEVHDFPTHLHNMLQSFAASEGVAIAAEIKPAGLIHDRTIATHVFRIVQEAVRNAIRHGRADKISVRFRRNRSALTLTITDNGSGPGSQRGTAQGGIGLPIMRFRAGALGARLEFKTNPTGGAIVVCGPIKTSTEELRAPKKRVAGR